MITLHGSSFNRFRGCSRSDCDDPRYLPVAARDVAQASMDQYKLCVAEKRVDWTYMSPPASIFPGTRTGSYRLGTDVLLIDAHGDAKISMEDFAMAILDEVEQPTHHRARITAAY